MITFIVLSILGIAGAYWLIHAVDKKHSVNHKVLENKVERNQQAIKDTTKEILGYDPFDISAGGKHERT